VIDYKVVIPARMNSTRLPGKPLMDIQGKPMVIRVAEKCIDAVGIENMIVSTPDIEILKACDEHSIPSVRSSLDCETGTDRLVELMNASGIEYFINVQGDEPMLPANIIKSFVETTLKHLNSCIGYAKIYDSNYIESKSVVKVAVSGSRLVYASRSILPVSNEKSELSYLKHTGLYGFNRADLAMFGKFAKGPLEKAENVEILRLLENGIQVRAIEIPNFGRAVDSLADYEFVNKYGDFK
jgi:3-deoxy-manno-octulosonate cytidylyltransferase (CMP-KDO synthetase)